MEISHRELSNEYFFGFFRVLVDLLRFFEVFWKNGFFLNFSTTSGQQLTRQMMMTSDLWVALDDMAIATWQPP